MKVLVLGATGGTGIEIVRLALDRGHSVTAFVRSPERLKPFGDCITVKQGNLLNSAELEPVVKGHDAVLSGLGPGLFPSVVADAFAMEKLFRESGLDWTIVRPPELTDKPYTGKYRVREEHLPPFGFKISRADVADFMIKAAENRSSLCKIVGISN